MASKQRCWSASDRFELPALKGSLRAWQLLVEWLTREDYDHSLPGASFHVEAFIECSTKGKLLSRAVLSRQLQWLCSHLNCPAHLDEVEITTASGEYREHKPAVTAEPPMVLQLVQALELDVQHQSWRAATSACAVNMTFCPVRFKHVMRSRPFARTSIWAAFHRYMNKTATCNGKRGAL